LGERSPRFHASKIRNEALREGGREREGERGREREGEGEREREKEMEGRREGAL